MEQYNPDTFSNVSLEEKNTKGIINNIIAVAGPGLGNNYDRQIQGLTNFKMTFAMLI